MPKKKVAVGPSTEELIERLTLDFVDEWDDGSVVLTRRQLAKHVIDMRACWLTVAYIGQDLEKTTRKFKKPKITFVRYRKCTKRDTGEGYFKHQSKFTLAPEQFTSALPTLLEWVEQVDDLVEAADGRAQPLDPFIPASIKAQQELEARGEAKNKHRTKGVWTETATAGKRVGVG